MIKRADSIATNEIVNMRGGDGTVVMRPLLDPKTNEFYGKGRVFNRIVVNPGCSMGLHRHDGELEVYYILSGEGIYNDNGVESRVYPGDVTVTYDGESHGLSCAGDTPVELVALILYK